MQFKTDHHKKTCPRCQNQMVAEVFEDYEGSSSPRTFPGYRCIVCGAIVDPVILANQARRPEPIYGRARASVGGIYIHSRTLKP